MKNLSYLSLVSLLVFTACLGHVPKGEEKKDLVGKWDGRTFTNDYFDLKMTLNDNWKLEESKHNSLFGMKYIDAKYFTEQDSIDPQAILLLESDKINPFDDDATVTKELESTREGLRMLYDQGDIYMDDLQKVQLGKRKFILSKLYLIDGSDTTFIEEYMSYEKDYFLDLNISYFTKSNAFIAEEIINQLKKN